MTAYYLTISSQKIRFEVYAKYCENERSGAKNVTWENHGTDGRPHGNFCDTSIFYQNILSTLRILPENVVASSHGDWTTGVKEENCEIESLLN